MLENIFYKKDSKYKSYEYHYLKDDFSGKLHPGYKEEAIEGRSHNIPVYSFRYKKASNKSE